MVVLPMNVYEDLYYKQEVLGMNKHTIVHYLLLDDVCEDKYGRELPLKAWLYEDINKRFDVLLHALLFGYLGEEGVTASN